MPVRPANAPSGVVHGRTLSGSGFVAFRVFAVGLLLFIIILAVWGFVIGGLARWALPGPDPMSVWMTIALGLAGSFLGALLLLIVYRKYVQHRPITGPGAQHPPPT